MFQRKRFYESISAPAHTAERCISRRVVYFRHKTEVAGLSSSNYVRGTAKYLDRSRLLLLRKEFLSSVITRLKRVIYSRNEDYYKMRPERSRDSGNVLVGGLPTPFRRRRWRRRFTNSCIIRLTVQIKIRCKGNYVPNLDGC